MQYFMTEAFSPLTDIPLFAGTPPWAETLITIAMLGAVAWLANLLVRKIVLRFVLRPASVTLHASGQPDCCYHHRRCSDVLHGSSLRKLLGLRPVRAINAHEGLPHSYVEGD